MTTENDKTRFTNVVEPHLADAYALARWITGSRADAEDVVQEACLRAFRAIGRFGGNNARAWTLTIVRNTAYTWIRKNRAVPYVAIDNIDEVESAQSKPGADMCGVETPTPEAELIARADAAALEAAIAALPTPFRETLVLRDLRGLDYREIAMVTEVPVGTVMSRLARARQRLIAALGAGDR